MAKQMILSFDVENQTLKRKDENKIVEKSKNYVHAIFFFTEEWDDTQKAAIIENGGMRFKVYLENNECDIPNRAVSHDGFTITIVGEDEENNITITTTDLFIAVQKNNASDIQEEYIKNITSDTLDLTREGENCNIEIPDTYKNCYIVTRNDVSDITPVPSSSGTYSVTLSEEMASVVTGFKQNLYVDWEVEFPDVLSTLGGIKVTNCYPSKKIQVDAELETFYIFSATDGYTDFNMNFYYVNDTWRVAFTNGNLADKEYVIMETSRLEEQIGEKSKVVANPTLSGDEATLEGAEIDGIKYKVGGGSEVHLYRHRLSFGNGKFLAVFDTFSSTPITQNDLKNTYATAPTPFSVSDTFSGYLLAPMTFTASQFGNFFGCIKIMEDGSGASFVSETAPLNQDTVTQIS